MESLIAWGITTLTGAFLGSFLAGYLKQKGENLATHEDIDGLVDQVKTVTRATKEIEAKISDDMWTRQKKWELKREVLFEATKRLADIDDALISYDSVLRVTHNRQDDDVASASAKHEALMRWSRASTAFDETKLIVRIVCGKETTEAFDQFALFIRLIAAGINKNDLGIYKQSGRELATKLLEVQSAIRKELGI